MPNSCQPPSLLLRTSYDRSSRLAVQNLQSFPKIVSSSYKPTSPSKHSPRGWLHSSLAPVVAPDRSGQPPCCTWHSCNQDFCSCSLKSFCFSSQVLEGACTLLWLHARDVVSLQFCSRPSFRSKSACVLMKPPLHLQARSSREAPLSCGPSGCMRGIWAASSSTPSCITSRTTPAP